MLSKMTMRLFKTFQVIFLLISVSIGIPNDMCATGINIVSLLGLSFKILIEVGNLTVCTGEVQIFVSLSQDMLNYQRDTTHLKILSGIVSVS